MYLIVGLGNPGSRYRGTRHNIGFRAIEAIASCHKIQLNHTDRLSQWGRGVMKGEEVLLAKPLTYMNLSGQAVCFLMSGFHLTPHNLLVLYDDMDLPLGKIRVRDKGSSGGHKGLESIIQQVGTPCFTRLRIGIGRPLNQQGARDYVLTGFSEEELITVNKVIEVVTRCVEVVLIEGPLRAMNTCNGLRIDE